MFEPRDLPLLAVFAAVVRHGSFTAAARELRVAKSVTSDNVRVLEGRCGVRLLERTTRRLRLTQAGAEVLRSAERALALTDEVRALSEAHRDAPAGTLRIAATLELGARFVAPAVASLCAAHPALRAELLFDDGEIDLVGRGVDAALRLGVPRASGFAARKLADDVEIVAAAPALAAAWERARRPGDLAGAPWVEHASLARATRWSFRGPRGTKEELAPGAFRATAT